MASLPKVIISRLQHKSCESETNFIGLQVRGGSRTRPHELARDGRLEELKRLLEDGVHDAIMYVVDGKGSSLLHASAMKNQVDIMQHLVEIRIDLNAIDNDGNTALHVAVENGCVEAMHLLLNSGASDTIRNHHQDPPLHTALCGMDIAVVAGFLEHPVDIIVRGFRNRTPLHVIAEHDNIEALEVIHKNSALVKELFKEKKGFQLNDADNLTPIHLAARKGSYRVLEFMFSKSSEYGYQPRDVMHFLDEENATPLQFAVESGSIWTVGVLLQHGASPTVINGDHLSPLHLACSQGKLEMVQAMVNHCGPEILHSRHKDGKTALHYGVTSVQSEHMIMYLLEQRAELEAEDYNGCTALHVSIIVGNLTAVEELLKRGMDPTRKGSGGSNALHYAVVQDREEVVKLLLAHPAAPSLLIDPDSQGNIPIHYALDLGLSGLVMPMITSILTHHKKINFQDRDRNNYIHLAARSGDFETLSQLLKLPAAHCMLNEVNKAGGTPLHSAAEGCGTLTCINALVNQGAVVHKCHSGLTPLMISCKKGNLNTVRALYHAHPFQKDWEDDDGNTALHHAVKGGNPDVLKFCLDIGIRIIVNHSGQSFLDLILNSIDTELALVAMKHDRWQEFLDVSSTPHPILRLVERIPEGVHTVLDNCYSTCTLDPQHPQYWEESNFRYLRLVPEDTGDSSSPAVQTSVVLSAASHSTAHQPIQRVKTQRPFEVLRWMLRYKRKKCLLHPVVVAYLKTKWSDYGRFVYLTFVGLFALLTIFLSIFIGITPPPTQNVPTEGSASRNESDKDDIDTASNVIRFITLFICTLNTLLWIFMAYILKLKALNFNNYLWMWTFAAAIVCTYIFLIPWKGLDFIIWEAGAIAIFASWFTLALLFEWIGVFGIYITMFLEVTKSVFQALVVYTFFLLAFVFPLYILLGSLDGLYYSTLGHSFYTTLNTLVAIINFFDFISLDAADSLQFPSLTFIFLSLMTILLPIVIINLLIGLAVGDIDAIRADAIFRYRAIEVEFLSYVDDMMPRKLLKHFERKSYKIYPNAKTSLAKLAWHISWKTLKSGKEGNIMHSFKVGVISLLT